ncbi:hypothetical protein D3C81_1464830 [compost metagenome]
MRLVLHRFGGRRRLFHQRRILLGDGIHLADGAVDLVDAHALLAAGGRDFRDDVAHALHAVDDIVHGRTGLRHQHAARVDLLHGRADQGLDFLRGTGRTLGQVAHFRCHDGETTALLAGARRFHCRVQGQDIRLESDTVDHGNNVDDLVRRGVDRLHRAHHLRHHVATLDGHLRRRGRQLVGLARIVRILLHGAGQFFHRGSCFFQRTGLLFRAARQVLVAGGDLRRRGGDAVRAAAHFADDVEQAGIHVFEGK